MRLRRRGNIVGHNYQRQKDIVQILNKPPDEKRSEKDLKKLEPLLSELRFFTKTRPMDIDERLEVCKNLRYEFKEPGGTVFRQGDAGDKFYIIIKGECQVSIPDPLSSEPAKKRLTTK